MKGKAVIVTGASSGIGRQLAVDLAAQECRLALAARRSQPLETLAAQIGGDARQVLVQPTDITHPDQCRRLIDASLQALGQIDCLILNAGISMWSRFEDITDPGVFERIIRTNYLGSVYCVQAALPHLKQSRGMIVAVTSTQAIIGLPHHSAYSASKHAVRGFLEALDLELDGQVHILQVMPGWVKGTNLRASALKGDGQAVGRQGRAHGKDAVGVEDLSQRIIKAMQSRRKELFVPSKLRFVPWLKLIAPGWLRKKIRRATAQE